MWKNFTAKGARAVGNSYRKSKGKGKDSKGKSKFEGTCYNCGKTGHKASECYQRNVRSVDEVQEVGMQQQHHLRSKHLKEVLQEL